jgi:REP element-mobilizing transposase RayT
MGRRRRIDYPGAWHHVFNRGIARRTMFESALDMGRFEDLLRDVVERQLVEVHAYCMMSTHFHLLVRSVDGEVSKAIGRLTNLYSRSFNRGRRRDGPLVRGRFGSRLVEDDVYWLTVVRYIDLNPVGVMCDVPSDFAYGSAFHYRRGEGPTWLTRDLVARAALRGAEWDGGPLPDYDRFATATASDVVRAMVNGSLRRNARSRSGCPALRYADLVRGAPERQRHWMEFKARLADGTSPGALVLAPSVVCREIRRRRCRLPDARSGTSARRGSLWDVMESGVLRSQCAVSLDEAARLLGVSAKTVERRQVRHACLLRTDERYRRLVVHLARTAVDRALGEVSSEVPGTVTVSFHHPPTAVAIAGGW